MQFTDVQLARLVGKLEAANMVLDYARNVELTDAGRATMEDFAADRVNDVLLFLRSKLADMQQQNNRKELPF